MRKMVSKNKYIGVGIKTCIVMVMFFVLAVSAFAAPKTKNIFSVSGANIEGEISVGGVSYIDEQAVLVAYVDIKESVSDDNVTDDEDVDSDEIDDDTSDDSSAGDSSADTTTDESDEEDAQEQSDETDNDDEGLIQPCSDENVDNLDLDTDNTTVESKEENEEDIENVEDDLSICSLDDNSDDESSDDEKTDDETEGPEQEEAITVSMNDITVKVQVMLQRPEMKMDGAIEYVWEQQEIREVNVEDGAYRLPLDFLNSGCYKFVVYAEDKYGNKSTNKVELENYVVENASPNAKITIPSYIHYDEDRDEYFVNADQNMAGISMNAIASTQDDHWWRLSIDKVSVSINGAAITESFLGTASDNSVYITGAPIWDDENCEKVYNYGPVPFHTWQSFSNGNSVPHGGYPSSYSVSMLVRDDLGHEGYDSAFIYVDDHAPVVDAMSISGVDVNNGFNKYVYFSNSEKQILTASVKDVASDESEHYSGLDSVEYSIVNSGKEDISESISVSNNEINLELTDSFKGYVKFKAKDFVGNESDWYSSEGIIIESQKFHDEDNHISLEIPQTSVKDISGYNLYGKSADVTVVLTDDFSGIKSMEWSVEAPYDTENNISGTVNFSSSSAGYKLEKDEFGLITRAEGKITVKNNSNAIHVVVKMTDNSGNTSSSDIYLSIDGKAPKVETELINSESDETYSEFYKDNQFVRITVTDANFCEEGVLVANNEQLNYHSVSGFKCIGDGENGEKVYSTIVAYTLDGEYDLCFEVADIVGNTYEKKKEEHFVVDKTLPELELSFSETEGNGIYYRENRIMYITVKDDNFTEYRVDIIRDEDTAYISKQNEWTENKGAYSTYVTFEGEAKYGFTVEVTDKAGNMVSEYIPSFVVDKNAPIISFSGVENEGAYNAGVSPKVSISDGYYDKENLDISISGDRQGKLETLGVYEDTNRGQRFTFDKIEMTSGNASVDDVYTITVRNVDKAGNESTEDIVFSVNYLGSSYEISENLSNIAGSYVHEVTEVRFTEINPSRLVGDETVVTLYRNGIPMILKEGTDYEISKNEVSGKYSVYDYHIFDECFVADGVYEITVSTIDEAGNSNDNTQYDKDADIRFAVDNTAPIINVYGVASNDIYELPSKTVEFASFDNLTDTTISVFVNGEEYIPEEKNGTYSIELYESVKPYNVLIKSYDVAGNVTEVELNHITISQSAPVRYWNDTLVRNLSIAGAVLVLGIGIRITLHVKGIRVFTRIK